MKKAEVELIVISIKSGSEEALHLKVYKDGTLARRGCGGLPGVKISGMSFTGGPAFFDQLMQHVSQQVLDQPVHHEEEIISKPLEYLVAFYGQSDNGEQGERASWTKSCGLRFFMDENTGFRHQLLGFTDGFAVEAVKLTDAWYFDIVMLALDNMRSSALPEQTLAMGQDDPEAKELDFRHYFEQAPKKGLPAFAAGKTYLSAAGLPHRLDFEISDAAITYKFIPVSSFN